MKKYRKQYGKNIRYYHCGEYGETYGRPHYHAIIFGHDWDDKKHFKTTNEVKVYTSERLQRLWGKGFTTTGDVTFESASYVARYILKKVTGDQAKTHYEHVDENGEVHAKLPEYTTMSRRPGIGAAWYKKFRPDVYPHDHVIIRGKEMRPPRYYSSIYEQTNLSDFQAIRSNRKISSRKNADNNTPQRLKVRETVKLAQLTLLKRDLDT